MPVQRRVIAAERGCLAVLFLWLAWLPLPYGSIVERSRGILIGVPLLLCAVAALVRLYATRDRSNAVQPTRPWAIWWTGGMLFLLVGALQLLPLPAGLHQYLSPESHAIWTSASRVAALAGVSARATYPLTVDPPATALELLRIAALVAAFSAGALLMRTHLRRLVLAYVLCATATFEALFGVREAALQQYEIWGWVNRLIYDRVTGTFVNPNHFGHYLAITLPMALFLGALAWHLAGRPETPLGQRIVALAEHHLFLAGFAVLAAIACIVAVLLAQSRGALLALAAGLFAVAAMLPGRRIARLAFGGVAGAVLIVALVVFLGPGRTVARFVPNEFERQTFVGRRIGIEAAAGVWERFPVAGSGLGTFDRVVSMEQRQDLEKIYHHAHNDYMEIAATAGTLGVVIAVVALIGGYAALVRMTFGSAAAELTWRRRAFQTAALASLTVAMVHALFDFNFFIPSNPATLAVILGAAVASVDHDVRRSRR
jgi:putative inorganic carbon (HCO3(-)) transporter